MGELIELSYRRFPKQIIDTLIKARYLLHTDRHKPSAVKRAWDCLRRDATRTSEGRRPVKE
jgi:hypothetical protein